MSSVYNLEPQPTAKVLLQTTAGDIELELFAKQTPLTSRNFLQLCLDEYYDNTIFHRLVSGFIIQGGDPSGTGSGGESSYDGEPFADEFHSRLKFNRRGLLGMANTGRKDDNGSQFFFTLGNTPELTGKNTMFGRVAGDTIYNLMKMGEADLADDESERPLYPTKITGAEIIVNPFEDMVKRVRVVQPTVEEKKEKKKPKRKAGKQLLSFGGDEGGDGEATPAIKRAKFNPKLVSVGEEGPQVLNNPPMSKAPERKREMPIRKPVLGSPSLPPPPRATKKATPPPSKKQRSPSPSPSPSTSPEPESSKQASLLERTNAQIAELKASMKRNTGGPVAAAPRKKSALEAMIPETSIRGRKRRPGAASTTAEQQTLSLFNAFKSKLEQAPPEETNQPASSVPQLPNQSDDKNGESTNGASQPPATDEEAALCDLHFIASCQSCTSWDTQAAIDEPDDDAGWMSHALSFAKDRLGKDLEWKRKNEEELVVIDPREKARELKEEKRGRREGAKERVGDKGREWDRERGKGKERR